VAPEKAVSQRAWVNVGLAALVAILAWWVFFKPETLPKENHKLSTLTATSIDAISIALANRPRVVLTKRKDEWFVSEPFQARADSARVESLLGLLTAQSATRLPAQDLARFQLDAPLARVRIGRQEFFFGATQPLSNQLYVLTQGSVYLISPVYFVDVAKQPADYVSKQLLASNEIPVAFEFPRYKLTQLDGKWRMTSQASAPTQDEANIFADEWRHAIAMSVAPAAATNASELVSVKLNSGKWIKAYFTRNDTEWMLTRDDEKLTYQFTAEAAKRLLQPKFAPP
jgi:hypothetical protein